MAEQQITPEVNFAGPADLQVSGRHFFQHQGGALQDLPTAKLLALVQGYVFFHPV